MTETKFTPGPWTAVVPHNEHIHDGRDISNYSVYAENEFHDDEKANNKAIVSMQFTSALGLAESTANAHLIAAAPELHEALSDMVLDWDHELPEDRYADFVGRARKALAKARGES